MPTVVTNEPQYEQGTHRKRRLIAIIVSVAMLGGGLIGAAVNVPRAQAQDFTGALFAIFNDTGFDAALDAANIVNPLKVQVASDPQRTKQRFIDRLKASFTAMLKVAGDYAYKTSVRIFYMQLTNVTTEFIRTAGTGEKPIFISNPHYWENVFDAAQNDFLDSVSQDVFGIDLAAPDAEKQRQIGLFARSMLNPNNVCETQALKDYNLAQEEVKKIKRRIDEAILDKKMLKADAKAGVAGTGNTIFCPLAGDPLKDPHFAPDEKDGQYADATVCIRALEDIVSVKGANATKNYTNTMRGCRNQRASKRVDPILQETVGNAALADAVQELYDSRKNDLGNTLEVLNKAADKSASAVAAEQTAQNTKVGPTRTVAGLITAPASLVEDYTKQALEKSTNDVDIVTGSRIADVVSKAIGNALIQRIVKEWFKSKCGLSGVNCKTPTGTSTQARQIFGLGVTTAAATRTNQFSKTTIVTGEPSKNPTPTIDEIEARGIVDTRFRQAVEEGLTVREAIDRGLLDGNRTFGFDQNNNMATDGYSYQTILYLRRARVIPVGWQLAAEYKFVANAGALGLGELVEKFSMCGQDAEHDDDPKITKYCSGGAKATTICAADVDCTDGATTYSCAERFTPSPYCGLVDPDWVLKAPLSYCKKKGSGEELVTKIFLCEDDTNGNGRVDCTVNSNGGGDTGRYDIQRNEDTCVDEPTCVAENEDGSCLSYGYCFEDRRSFKFDGNRCPSYYASCRAYTNAADETVAYLSKSLDVNGCGADNAGCLAFCSDRKLKDGSWMCVSDPNRDPSIPATRVACAAGETCTCRMPNGDGCSVTDGTDQCTTSSGTICYLGENYTFFDRDVKACDAANEGCTEYISMVGPTNLLGNGSFETFDGSIDDAVGDNVPGWGLVGGGLVLQATTSDLPTPSGNRASLLLHAIPPAAPQSGLTYTADAVAPAPQGVDTGRPLSFRDFTLSYDGKATVGTCGEANGFGIRSADGAYNPAPINAVYTTTWARYSNTFTVPDLGYTNDQLRHILKVFISNTTCDILVDNVQLEASSSANVYNEYGTVNTLGLNNKRRTCDRVDVGCESYKPARGGDSIAGVVNPPDMCAKDDVGCRQYRKEAITHIPPRPALDPVHLVPSSGTLCKASEVGCEEYTNLDKLAAGGEAREYYTSIKQCVKPDPASVGQATYFTWVGDDRSGFQLKSYRLKVSDLLNYSGETGNAPCTNLTLGTSATDNNPSCDDQTFTPKTCTALDIGVNPDCAQYFDGAGHIFYRFQSRVIPVSDDCHPYRNSIDEAAALPNVYHILSTESPKCGAAAAMCRAFTGNAGNNVKLAANINFENTTALGEWLTVGPDPAPELSSESVNASGHSLKITGTVSTQAPVLEGKLTPGSTYVISLWAKPGDASARVIQDAMLVFNLESGAPTSVNFGGVSLTSEWHVFELGPVSIPASLVINSARLYIRGADGAGGAAPVFIDNIQIKEITDSIYLVDKSFRECNVANLGCEAYTDPANKVHYLKSFTRLCSNDAVGCSALFDTKNSSNPFLSVPIQGISVPRDQTVPLIVEKKAICSTEFKGCTAYGQAVTDVSKKVRSYDTVFLLNNPDQHLQILCSKNDLYCSEFTGTDGSKSYFKDPGNQVCEYRRLGGESNYHWYIKGTSMRCPVKVPPQDGIPAGKSCVRSCRAGDRAGLACVSDFDCPGSFCQGDDATFGRSCNNSSECVGGNICDSWTGICPEEQDGCNEYRDPTEPAQCRATCGLEISGGKPVYVDSECVPTTCIGGPRDGNSCRVDTDCPGFCEAAGPKTGFACSLPGDCGGGTCKMARCSAEGLPGCRSYYYIKQSVEQNAADCNGRIDITNGCRPFNDTSKSTLNYRAF